MSEKLKPSTSYELIHEWMTKAQKTCAAQGKKDSALLWADALQHLEYQQRQLDTTSALLEKAVKALRELVALKHIKDTEGKTLDYCSRQPVAWKEAEAVIAELTAQKG